MIRALLLAAVAWTAVAEERATELPPVRIWGEGPQFLARPLTPKKVVKGRLELHQFTDVNRALKQTPGVYAREEDGVGLRPNIGLRGTNPDRSKKVTLMEDGVLIGIAPFSAPAAYYTPNMGQSESLEIYKGFAALPFGPNSVGGAINYVTPAVPPAHEHRLKAATGSFGTHEVAGSAGGPLPFGGFLVRAARLQSDGFKRIDGGGDAGFAQNLALAKLRADLPGEGHNVQATYGFGEEDSHETYVGLSDEDFSASILRRYSSTAKDKMKWRHQKYQLRHQLPLSDTALLETTLYQHRFHRAWYRLDRFRDANVNLRDILRDPTGANAPYYDILRGAADSSTLGPTNGQLVVVNNDRTYLSQGLQTKFSRETGRHAIELFARLHSDRIDRNHSSDRYDMISGRMQQTVDPTQTDAENFEKATAVSIYALDNWTLGSWTLTPALRRESAEFRFQDHLTGNRRNRRDEVWLPGLGVTKRWGERTSTRVSVNRAATLAGIAIDGTERREEATNYEFEVKYSDPRNELEGSVVWFYNDYKNITGTCTASSGCAPNQLDQMYNGGKAKVAGVELGAGKAFRSGAVAFPVHLNLTLLEAEFASEFQSTAPDWGAGTVRSGDPLPYVPQVQYSFSLGTEYRRWKQDLSLVYQGEVFDQAAAGRRAIPGHGVVDWAGSYEVAKAHTLSVKADNVLDRRYVAAARPYGLRPGKPRALMAAWTWAF